jgi:hypothetical protein
MVASTSASPLRGVATSRQVTFFRCVCVPTHPHNEGAVKGTRAFIGAGDGEDDGLDEGIIDSFEIRVGVEVGLEDGIKGGYSK